jgi:predicted nucleotidyltransferase
MDIGTIKIDVLRLRTELKKNNIHPDLLILFGSYADNRARPESDIDIAVVSRDYGKSRFAEGAALNLIATHINPNFEGIPISLADYINPNAASPILNEIRTKGIVLF